MFKKAHELSVLCSVDVAVIIFGNNKKLYEYSSSDIGELIQRHGFVREIAPVEVQSLLIIYSMAAQMNTKDHLISMAKETEKKTTRTDRYQKMVNLKSHRK